MNDHPVLTGRQGRAVRAAVGEDTRLILAIRARDLHAFEELYRNYHPRLTRFLTSLVHRPHNVEEILHDTMMAIWEKPESFRGESKLSTWIFAIAYRKAMKSFRRRDEPVEDHQAASRIAPDEAPDRQAGRHQVEVLLLRAMAQLSPDHRAVVDLTYFHEMGYREIAEILGCPVNTVKTRMFHARRHLRTILSGDLEDWV